MRYIPRHTESGEIIIRGDRITDVAGNVMVFVAVAYGNKITVRDLGGPDYSAQDYDASVFRLEIIEA